MSEDWTRQDLVIQDGQTTMTLNIWGQNLLPEAVKKGSRVLFKHVHPRMFNGKLLLTSTPETTFQVNLVVLHFTFYQLLYFTVFFFFFYSITSVLHYQ